MKLNAAECEALFGQILDGQIPDEEITSILIKMADRGETADEMLGAVRAIRSRMIHVYAPPLAMDVAGTGGDGQHSMNVSTAVAIVVAACDVPIAKCGNRAASSLAGTADTLEALGLDIVRATQTAEQSLADIGIGFIFAQSQVPVMARLGPIRKAIGRKTIFNLLGPMYNMANVSRQLIGVPSPDIIPVYAEALTKRGVDRAMIVSGEEGLDELSVSGPSRIYTIGFAMPSDRITPEDAGLSRYTPDQIKGGNAAFNAAALRRLLQGEAGAYRDAVLLNAAAALIVAGEVANWQDGVEEAAEVIDKGLANALLNCWINYNG